MTKEDAAGSDRNEERQPESTSSTTSNPQGIFTGQFEVYRTVTEDEYQVVLTSGLIVLDTSTLLDLYRYHAKTREDLIQVLVRLRGRVWVPNHAMYEFFENRLGVIDNHAKELNKAIADLNGYSTALDRAIRAWVNRVSLPLDQRQELFEHDLSPILARLNGLVSRIRQISDDQAFEHASDTARDPVIAVLNEILTDGAGAPLSAEELQSAKEKARKRIENKVPPGWKDADKKENQEGDYLIWYQTLQEAKRRGTDVLFVTSDIKEDWWRVERGAIKGPLPALMHEMREIAGVRLYMLRPASLLTHAGAALGVEVRTESVQDAERVSVRNVWDNLAQIAWRHVTESNDLRPRVAPSRWRYTSNGFDLGTVANLSQRSFSHPSYMLAYDKKVPAFRVGAFVACDVLDSDELTADYLRSQMRSILDQSAVLGLIANFTSFPANAQWRSQPGRGRFSLEADLMSPLAPDAPAASALLLMPEAGLSGLGRNLDGAELYIHINLLMTMNADGTGSPESGSLADWYRRFAIALRVPEILAQFLESIGLPIRDEPNAKFALQIQGRTANQLGIEEVVDFGNLEALTPRKYSAQFDGWAVADTAGKPANSLAKRFLSDLCESVGRTGYDGLLARLPD